MSLGKRLWEVARANVSDFGRSFRSDDDPLTREERAKIEAEVDAQWEARDSVGSRVGRRARRARDRAEEAWEAAYESARASAEGSDFIGHSASSTEIAGWYRTLEVEQGADFATVRSAYRKLLLRYHPDRFANEPEKHRAATEVAQKITIAYNGLKVHLGDV